MADYKQKKNKDKEVQTNGFENRSEDFEQKVITRGEIYDLIRDLLEDSTHKVFDKKGIEPIESYFGIYATGKKYGAGIEKGKYEVRLFSNVKSIIQKQIIFGTKKIESEITIDFDSDNNLLTLHYNGTEGAVFKGHMHNDDAMGDMINDKITINTKNKTKLKKELSDFFENCSKKEINYLLNTKLGVDDKVATGVAGSLYENKKKYNMKLNDLLNSSPQEIADFFENKLHESKQSHEKIDLHPQDVIDANSKGKLLFDDEIKEEEVGGYQKLIDKLIAKNYPGKQLKDLSKEDKNELFLTAEKMWTNPKEKHDLISESKKTNAVNPYVFNPTQYAMYVEINNNRLDAFNNLNDLVLKENKELEEITTAGSVGATGTAGDFYYQSPKIFADTNYAKNKNKRAAIKKTKNEGDSFWTKIDIDTLSDTHPMGMPGVKVNSKDELKKTTSGGASTTKFIKKLKEQRTSNEDKRKFFNEAENEIFGINKRYLVTHKLSEQQVKNKWSKLSNFISESSIEKDPLSKEEEMLFKECGCSQNKEDDKMYTYFKGNVVDRDEAEELMNQEFEEQNSDLNNMADLEDLIDVEKPNSFVVLKISRSDLMNENKKFVFDHNTKNFVLHPAFQNANMINENKKTVFDLKTKKFVPNPKYK